MVHLTEDEIIYIHGIVEERFGISKGIINKGILDAVIQRPDTTIDGKNVYDTVFLKAASILESIIRWHPFADGNKRTALLATIYYLKLAGYGFALPLSAVRYTVKVAKNKKTDEESTQKLLRQIAEWLENHSGKTKKELAGKIWLYLTMPYRVYGFLYRIGFQGYVSRKVAEWLAFDIYPEYEKEAQDIMQFISDTLQASVNVFDEEKK